MVFSNALRDTMPLSLHNWSIAIAQIDSAAHKSAEYMYVKVGVYTYLISAGTVSGNGKYKLSGVCNESSAGQGRHSTACATMYVGKRG